MIAERVVGDGMRKSVKCVVVGREEGVEDEHK
jgi:hypothetical protein